MTAPTPSSPNAAPPVQRDWRPNLRGDFLGATVSAALAIPLAMGYGMFAFVALGDQYFASGVLAGLVSAFTLAVVSLILGDRTTTIYAPRVVTTFFLGLILAQELLPSGAAIIREGHATLVITVVLLIVFVAGFFQFLFGLLRVGSLLKYTPHPVLAGFQNAAALLLALVQAGHVLGYSHHVRLAEVVSNLPHAKPLNVLVAAVTCIAMWNARSILPKIPPLIVGLVAGCAFYYALDGLGFEAALGPAIGDTPPVDMMLGNLIALTDVLRRPDLAELMSTIVFGGLSLAAVASLDALLCARLLQPVTGFKPGGDRQLIRLGIGNMVAAVFGGITSGINLGPTLANRAFGGRTPLAVLINAGWVLVAIFALMPIIAFLPRVVLSAIIVVVAIQHFDPWTVGLVKKLVAGRDTQWKSIIGDLTIVLVVAVTAIAADLLTAVLLGVAITILFFLFRMSVSVVRRAYRCDAVHSRKTRMPEHMEVLGRHGRRILVLELEGPIFFGSAENLAAVIEAALRDAVAYVILDLKRVNEIDSTGARILLQIHDRMLKEGKFLLLASLQGRAALTNLLRDMGVIAAVTHGRIFPDTDHAIEWAEDHLILSFLGDIEAGAEFPFGRLDVLAQMNEEELAAVRKVLSRRIYGKGDLVFLEGDQSDELYIIAKGSASVGLKLPGDDRETRLATFAPGTMFGEIALLDQAPRSATVRADEPLVCYVLTRVGFDTLTSDHPAVTIKLLANLDRELAARLRRANRTIQEFAS